MTVTMNTNSRILLVDSYDSFTNNLAALFRRSIPGCDIHIIRNDEIASESLAQHLHYFSAVVVGPGPGSPTNPVDVGIVKDLWNIADEHLLPVFGVCLGLQSLAVEFGARLKRLNVVKHGQVSQIIHVEGDLFKGVGDLAAVRYHSLHVDLDNCEVLEPLAWADDGKENGRVVMAAKHKVRPFWAVQYHPESVCTHGGGVEVVQNFWRLAKKWTLVHDRMVRPWNSSMDTIFGPSWATLPLVNTPSPPPPPVTVSTRVLDLAGIAIADVCEMLGVTNENSGFVLLDSAAQPGRFSIVGCLTSDSPKITYTVGDVRVRLSTGQKDSYENLGSSTIWTWLADFMRPRRACGGVPDLPFWGGLVGFLSYELGVQSLSASLCARGKIGGQHPDVNLVFVERSIVVDGSSNKVYVQSLLPDDGVWLDRMSQSLKQCTRQQTEEVRTSPAKRRRKSAVTTPPVVALPDREKYIARINQCKEHLFAGDSYELCLTAPTRISVPKTVASRDTARSSSWELYKVLRARNPAPHAAYLRLHPSTLLSSSPERFLSYSRPPYSICQLRPIKGTVRKAPGVTRAVAEQALSGSTKEVAENLMIVDLIRHDLHGVVGEDVVVKQFCKVEEYKTVWQLVSVIEGKLPDDAGRDIEMELGWEILRRSLPPGSMTGAPKKRSVEILHTLEDYDRGIYSGVFGYWCVGGGSDWSVTIRSCFKHDDPMKPEEEAEAQDDSTHETPPSEEWVLGAGGAITALSDPEAEWEEMVVKVESVIRAFGEVEFS